MPGKNSRARRVEAVQKARQDVYASRGAEMGEVPFSDERQARIYQKAYLANRRSYHEMEALNKELWLAYTGSYEPR